MRQSGKAPGAERVCRLLRAMAGRPSGLSVADAVRDLGIPRATAFRLFDTLVAEGFAAKVDGLYGPGPELIRIGLAGSGATALRARAVPVLQRLAHDTGETAHLAIRSGDYSLILEVCDGPSPLRVASRPGSLVELNCSATGKLFLAAMAPEERRGWRERRRPVRLTDRTLITDAELGREADAVARRGYAVDDEEYFDGVRCCAAPVRDALGRVIAAVGITAAASRFRRKDVPAVAREIVSAACALSG